MNVNIKMTVKEQHQTFTNLLVSSWPAQGPPRRSFCGKARTGSCRGQRAREPFSAWSGSPSKPSADPPPPPLMSTVEDGS